MVSRYRWSFKTYILLHNDVISTPADLTELLPTLRDEDVRNGFTTKLLKEMVNDLASTFEHFEYLLFDMKITPAIRPRCNAVGISAASLLRNQLFSYRILQELINSGMKVTGQGFCMLWV